MAKLYLYREEMVAFRPPAVCMRCGAPSETRTSKYFLWTQGAGFDGLSLIANIIDCVKMLVNARGFRVPMPLCSKHLRRQIWQFRLMCWGLVSLLLLTCLGVIDLRFSYTQDNHFPLGGWS